MCCKGGGGALSSHHHVAAAVQGEVVRPGEGAVALSAAERFDSRVLTEVSGQLVRTGEAPGAALPGTVVGFLSWREAGYEDKLVERKGREEARYNYRLYTDKPRSVRSLVCVWSHLCVSSCGLSGGNFWCKLFYSLHSRTCEFVSS